MHFLIFTKFLGIFVFGLVSLIIYDKPIVMKNTFKGFMWVMFSSVSMLLCLAFTLLGLIQAKKSGANPGLLISLQLISTLVAFILGSVLFGEKASKMQFLGSVILVSSIAALLISRAGHDEEYVGTELKFSPENYWISVI